MGVIVMALFRPKSGREEDLAACLRDHLPLLQDQGLVTDRPTLLLRARNGTLVEIFEWKSPASIDAAHANPEVHRLWDRFAACCDYATLGDLDEAGEMFPGFAPVES